MKVKAILITGLFVWAIMLQGCLRDDYEKIDDGAQVENGMYSGFDFSMVTLHTISISCLSPANEPMPGVYLELYLENPLDGLGQITTEASKSLAFRGVTDAQGIFGCVINNSLSDSIFVVAKQIGLPFLTAKSLNSEDVKIYLGGHVGSPTGGQALFSVKSATELIPEKVNGYYVLGGWNSLGVPSYLEKTNDVIDNSFLADVNASLPETKPLTVTHPQYITSDNEASLVLTEDCEVWVTFVHEGAGWTNSLGYYTYPTKQPPTDRAQITDMTLIFPNVSYLNSGGGLVSGNKVKLQYLDPVNKQFTSVFPAGISIGWFMVAQGWKTNTVSSGAYTHFANPSLNTESDPDLQKHNVSLYDSNRGRILLGFEDVRRDMASDQDFNDAVFYSTANPVEAIHHKVYQPIDKPVDTDGDGTSDVFDQYPKDPKRAFNNYYPSKGAFGSLVFEDLWPYRGDYDFNDLVLDYNFNQITNSKNDIVSIKGSVVVRASGATYKNAFGISLNTEPSNVLSVTGPVNKFKYLDISANGTENNQSLATIIFFDDVNNVLPYPGSGVGTNTYPGNPFSQPDTLLVDIELVNSVKPSEMGTPPYNPFIIVNRNRKVEVHLPMTPPTDLADKSLFGTGQDNSNLTGNKHYVSDKNLPWALNLPISFDYPAEKKNIMDAYPNFHNWATNYGKQSPDWYLRKTGYRNEDLIYKK